MDGLPLEAMKPLATRVLLKLANVAAQDGCRAYRNVSEVAHELGVSHRSVQRALRELQEADLVRPGDQRAVAHIPGNRRPTVFDLNFGWHRMYGQPEIDLPDDDELGVTPGVTEFSTGDPGVTPGVTATVPLGTNGTSISQHTQTALVGNRASAKGITDGSAGSHRAASAMPGRCASGHHMIDDRHCEFGCLLEVAS